MRDSNLGVLVSGIEKTIGALPSPNTDEHKEAEPSSSFPIFLKYIESTFSDDIFTVLEMGILATTIPERSEAFLSHVLSLPSDDQVQLFEGALAQVSGE
ncbi:hypothetical protein WJX75_005782 [Coccomyxa subellipsoidea]|uniref:Uncharacterized protein n=1 Tax=Coccomyxa subellipsoidea TaxID=248742 RepID=A0ABR2YJH8_9CHLO